jgi:hypothetical protein
MSSRQLSPHPRLPDDGIEHRATCGLPDLNGLAWDGLDFG